MTHLSFIEPDALSHTQRVQTVGVPLTYEAWENELCHRVTGLLRTGVLKWSERPAWYDVYVAFPPHQEPRSDHIHYLQSPGPLKRLYYPEDYVRALYFKKIEQNEKFIDLTDNSTETDCDKFVKAWYEAAQLSDGDGPGLSAAEREDEVLHRVLALNNDIRLKAGT